MRSSLLRTLGVSVSALALATTLSGTSNASSPEAVTVGHAAGAVVVNNSGPAAKVCAANTGTPNGDGVTAQDFGPNYPELATEGAADFKNKKKCKVKSVDITGLVPGGGSGTSATATIYADDNSLPGKEVCSGTSAGTGPNYTVKIKKCKLAKKTTYWLGAQVAQDFETQGQFFWATTNDIQGEVDAWRNPGGGFGVCPDWDNLDACLGLTYDYLFAVNGK